MVCSHCIHKLKIALNFVLLAQRPRDYIYYVVSVKNNYNLCMISAPWWNFDQWHIL